MKTNKHPHHDLIVEWAKDTSKVYQWSRWGKNDYVDCVEDPLWNPVVEYRRKPREFTKGHWYPCLDVNSISVKMWTGSVFIDESGDTLGFNLDDFTEVGESLGEIKFEDAL